MQIFFSPLDYGFKWTDDWYTFDRTNAMKAAKKARDEMYKSVGGRKYTLSNQLVTKGGIGSGHPQIEEIISVYVLDGGN